ncbi:hypothetical protein G4Z16_15060 [Streptomyces bathyalis]|uniref:Uncharacterized protein n=1 Tax=Streptomyces bathyalis TaxID=2710756 RepID=A0A7T1T6V3_9ACTN|nr:hypothetical protein [Streptomyces bathyalis]QPP07485.1 hypothetical protein G4Z16_15060 [Streptomyces bathyalis]
MTAQGPGSPGSERPPGPESTRQLWTLFLVYLTPFALAAVVVLWAAFAGHDFGAMATVVAALVTVLPAMEWVGRRDDRIQVTRNRQIFLAALGVAVTGAAVTAFALSTASEDVTGRSHLLHAKDMNDGATAQLNVDAEPSNGKLELTLSAEDNADGAGTSCVPTSRLRFHGTDLAGESTVDLDDVVTKTLPVRANGPRVRLTITLESGSGLCQVDLTLKSVNYP